MLVITRGYLPLRAPLSHVQPQEAENGAIDEKEHEDHHEDLGNLTNSGARWIDGKISFGTSEQL